MTPHYGNIRQSGWWLVVFGLATLFGLLQTTQSVLLARLDDRQVYLLPVIVRASFDWYMWAALTPLLFRLTQLAPFETGRWHISLLVHVPVCFLFSLLILAAMVVAIQFVGHETRMAPMDPNSLFRIFFTYNFFVYVFIYWAIVGTCQALEFQRRFQERELRAIQLSKQLAEAQLQMLKMQLHPHFLFNTLNAISALIHKDVNLADRMIARLGELLRRVLETGHEQEVPLWREMDFVRPYLEIEQARLGSRLQVKLDIEPDSMDAVVPNFLLQPLVENAVLHGIMPKGGSGKIAIRAAVENDTLILEVTDDGSGLPHNHTLAKERIGLSNTRARLKHLYGTGHRFSLGNGSGRGCVARIELPYREHHPGPEDTPAPGPNSLISVS
jgi:two-component system, LytTR family, sensor kinase